MRIHLVTYATARFRHRQWVLGTSAMLHGIVDAVTHWTPSSLRGTDFPNLAPDIGLEERGSGFWAWKPYIILRKLNELPAGDMVFYCDIGRRYPFKILNRPLDPFLEWMAQTGQDFIPGLEIGWRGPLSTWTKQDAFVLTGMDHPAARSAPTVQASFSLWRAGPASRAFVGEWTEWCADRRLISDDPSTCGKPEHADFHEHRHDQSLLSLLCLRSGVRGYDAGPSSPPIDTRDPSAFIAHYTGLPPRRSPAAWRVFRPCLAAAEASEKLFRRLIQINADRPSHHLAMD